MRGLPALALLTACAAMSGCRCRSEPAPALALPHFYEWDALVDATARGDLGTAKVIARDLTGGAPTASTTEAAEVANGKIGAALGFYGFAEDTEELADGLVSAARGCGICHSAATIAPAQPEWSHAGGAHWVVDGLVWNRAARPPGGAPPLDVLTEAWSAEISPDTGIVASDDEIRAARLVVACAGCHG